MSLKADCVAYSIDAMSALHADKISIRDSDELPSWDVMMVFRTDILANVPVMNMAMRWSCLISTESYVAV